MTRNRQQRGRRGFTLIELIIALLVLTVVMVGVLTLFESANQLTVSQINRVDLQQTLRVAQNEIVRTVRLAGRGGLLAGADSAKIPQGWAIHIRNNVSSESVINTVGAPDVVDDTDVLTIRGVINTPVYLVEHLDDNSFGLDTGNHTGWVTVRNKTPVGGQDQNLKPLQDMLASTKHEALILVSAFDDRLVGVVEIDQSSIKTVNSATSVTLGFRYIDGSNYAKEYAKLSTDGTNPGVFPETLFERTRVGTVGILEEYRYYLRQGKQMDDPDEVATPWGADVRKLSRARLYPNMEEAYEGKDSNLKVDIADNVIDFQVALAFDDDDDGLVNETADGVGDDWFGNSLSDVATAAPWTTRLAGNAPSLRFMRLSTLARTAQIDRAHESREIVRLEDHAYPSTDPLNQDYVERRYPRIAFRTTVEMRNL